DRRLRHAGDARRPRPAARADPLHAAPRGGGGPRGAAAPGGDRRGRRRDAPKRGPARTYGDARRLGVPRRLRPDRPRRPPADARRGLPVTHHHQSKGPIVILLLIRLIGMVAPTRPGRAPGPVGLVLHQARYDLLGILRNRQARFFTLMLPLIFLVIFVGVFGNHTVGPDHVK